MLQYLLSNLCCKVNIISLVSHFKKLKFREETFKAAYLVSGRGGIFRPSFAQFPRLGSCYWTSFLLIILKNCYYGFNFYNILFKSCINYNEWVKASCKTWGWSWTLKDWQNLNRWNGDEERVPAKESNWANVHRWSRWMIAKSNNNKK